MVNIVAPKIAGIANIKENFAASLAFLPPPVPDVLIFVCGPPAMYESLCGPRDDPELTGVLRDLGYSKDQVIKF